MKKNLTIGTAIFVYLFLFSFNVFSQIDTVTEQVTDTIPYSISVDTSRISTSILYDNATHFINAKDFTGLNDSVYMNEYDARQLYSEMKSASIRNTATMVNLDDITILINEKIKQGKYPFYILNYDYNAIKSYAIDSGLIQIQNHIITDGLNRTESPYETNHLFAACPVSTKFLQSEINFEIVPILYLTNSANPINQIQIDFGDGIGWRNLNWNDVITIAYSDIGYKEIRFKVTFSNSSVYESKSKIFIEYINSNARTKANGQDQFNFTASIPYNGGNAKGIASVVLAPGHTCITKPFIFVEGIEFGNTPVVQNNAIVQYGDIGYVAFTQGPPTDYPQLLKLPVLISQLQNNGYDIIIVDFEDAATYIQRNAFLLIDIIKWVNDTKCSDNENVVVGASMGGLVTRYALLYMEQHPEIGKPHCTKLWCTFDTPHKGANIPLGAQLFIKHFADPKFGDSQDARDALSQKMWREATQQMLIYHLDETTRAYMHNIFWYEMAQMGNFPQKLRRIAIANGSYTMNNQGYNPGDEMIKYHWSGLGGIAQNDGHVFAMNGTSKKVKGKKRNNLIFWGDLPKKKTRIETTLSSNLSIDNAPGGVGNQIEVLGGKQYYTLFTLHLPTNLTISNYANINFKWGSKNTNMYVGTVDVPHSKFCFIPSISALAINTTNLTYNFLTNIPNQSAINNSISPFNSIYTNSSGQNELHVEITDGHNQEDAVNSNSNNIAWLINELQNSEDVATILPTISGTIHSTFNYGSTYNPFIKSCTINNNGILNVNANAAFGFGNFASSPTNGSHLEISSNGCTAAFIHIMQGGNFIIGDNSVSNTATVSLNSESKIEVESNGNFIIHDNSILELNNNTEISKFKSGANVHLLNNSQIIVKGGHALEIEPNANVTLEDGASIVVEPNSKLIMGDGQVFLNGSNASVYIKGTLEIPANTDLTMNGTGFYRFGVGNNIVMGQGSKVNIEGQNVYDEVIKIDNNASVEIQNHDVTIKEASINYGHYAQFKIDGGVHTLIKNIDAYTNPTSLHAARAFDISNTLRVTIESSTFSDFVDAIVIHDYPVDCNTLIKPSVTIKSCQFDNSSSTDIVAHDLQRTDLTIQGCKLQNAVTSNGIDLHNCNRVEIIGCDILHKTNSGIVANNINQLIINSGHIGNNQANGIEANNVNLYVRNGAVIQYNVNDGISMNHGGSFNPSMSSSLTIGDWGCAWIINNGGYGINANDCFINADAVEHSIINGSPIKANRFDGNGLNIMATGLAFNIDFSYPFWTNNASTIQAMSFKNNYWGSGINAFNGSVCFNSYSAPGCLNPFPIGVGAGSSFLDATGALTAIPMGCTLAGIDPTEMDPYDPYNTSARMSHTPVEIPQELMDATLSSVEPAGKIFAMAYRKMLENNIDEATFMLADYLSVSDPTALPDVHFEITQALAQKLATQLYALDPCSSPYEPIPNGSRMIKKNQIKQALASMANKKEIAKGIKIYPNPVEGITTVSFTNEAKENFVCTVYNMQGQAVKTLQNIESNSFTVDASLMPKGMYWIELKSKTKAYREKLVVE